MFDVAVVCRWCMCRDWELKVCCWSCWLSLSLMFVVWSFVVNEFVVFCWDWDWWICQKIEVDGYDEIRIDGWCSPIGCWWKSRGWVDETVFINVSVLSWLLVCSSPVLVKNRGVKEWEKLNDLSWLLVFSDVPCPPRNTLSIYLQKAGQSLAYLYKKIYRS